MTNKGKPRLKQTKESQPDRSRFLSWLDQFAEGRSALSTTSASTGPLVASSLRPSCCWTAVKKGGLGASGEAAATSPPNWELSGAHSRSKSYLPVRPVLS